jgi:hypothetical protein
MLALLFSDFGTPAVIAQPGHEDSAVTVLFDSQSLNDMGVLTDKPIASLDDAIIAGVDIKSAVITISGVDYRMTRPLADGYGLTTVNLTRI